MAKKNSDIPIDTLKLLYYATKDKMITEDELLSKDITPIFIKALEERVKAKELISIGIIGEVRTGKSLVGISLMSIINRYLIKYDRFLRMSDEREVTETEEDVKRKRESIDWLDLIQSDQIEFNRFISKGMENVCIVVDEFSKLGETGANSTTEEAVFGYYSDVFAGKYIHKISCSPNVILDPNATYILEIIAPNKKQKYTRCKLIYRNIAENRNVTLGVVNIDVGQTLEKRYYQRYKEKKFKRMDLLDKHGIRDIREMEFASIVLDAFEEVKQLAKVGKVSIRLILCIVDMKRRKAKRIYSMVTVNDIANRVGSMVELYAEVGKLTALRNKAKNINEVDLINRNIVMVTQMLNTRIKEEIKLTEVHEQYMNIK